MNCTPLRPAGLTMCENLRQVVMERDGLSADEIDELIDEAKVAIADGADPEEILAEYFGLETDYIFDLLS